MPSRRIAESTALALGLVVLFGAIYAVIARYALEAFPYSGDEYSLALQAELMARGLLKVQAPPHIEWLRVDHVVIDQFVRSKYPPGGPALLAIGARYGYAWLVSPIEGALTLAIGWHTIRRVLGARRALIGLVAMGAAPLFMFDSASFYMHAPTLLFLAISFAAIIQWTKCGCWPFLVIAGAAIGCAFLVRPIDAVLFGMSLLVFKNWRAILITAASAIPFVLANFWYQKQLFGGWLTDGYHAYHDTFIALYGESAAENPLGIQHFISPIQIWNHINIYNQMCLNWTLPGTVIAALFGAQAITKDAPERKARNFALSVIVVFCAFLLIMVSNPDDGPHPRYLSPIILPLALLAAAGFDPLTKAIADKFGTTVRTILVTAALVFGLAQFGTFLYDRIPKVWIRDGLYKIADGIPRDSIVIVRAQYPSRYARNGPFFDGPIFLSAPETVTSIEVASAYPGRPIYEAHEGTPWTIERVR
ncbi:MAG: glycosyltransferase family 39 protein [Kofleriaceae bacterium]